MNKLTIYIKRRKTDLFINIAVVFVLGLASNLVEGQAFTIFQSVALLVLLQIGDGIMEIARNSHMSRIETPSAEKPPQQG